MLMNANACVSEDKWRQFKLQTRQSFAYDAADLRGDAERTSGCFLLAPGKETLPESSAPAVHPFHTR